VLVAPKWSGATVTVTITPATNSSTDTPLLINAWNEDPKPFVWSKTAEEILNSLARYISRITATGH
jgi:hypothetical protein